MTTSTIQTGFAMCRLVPRFVALGALKRALSLHTLARWSWQAPRRGAPPTPSDRIASLVFRAGYLAGVPDRDCLQRSLLLYRELSRAGYAPELAVGFRRSNGELAGHAWVVVNGSAVGEPELDPRQFVGVLKFGEGGRLLPAAA